MKKKTILTKTEAGKTPASVPTPPITGTFPDNYNGMPYSVIVNSLLSMFGFKEGRVPEGARNTTLYKLARQLRYICDFNSAYIRSIVPTWGLPEEEVRQTIHSAVSSSRATEMPYEMRAALNDIQKPDLSTPAKRQEYLQRLNPLPEKMPFLMRYIFKRYGRNGRSALIAALPMLGTLLGRFESRYLDGRKHRPVFMVVVCGHAGSGKGFISDMQEWLLKPILEDDAKGQAELEAYNREREKKRGAKQLPDKPTPCIRVLSATSSNGKLLEMALNCLGQPLCVISEEIDESARANKNGAWSDKSDIYRKAFDGAIWGQDYLTYSGKTNLFLSLLFAGTYVSVRNYFSNVENGLMTRFFFTEMARDRGKNVEVRWDGETKDDREAARIVQSLYEHRLVRPAQGKERCLRLQRREDCRMGGKWSRRRPSRRSNRPFAPSCSRDYLSCLADHVRPGRRQGNGNRQGDGSLVRQ